MVSQVAVGSYLKPGGIGLLVGVLLLLVYLLVRSAQKPRTWRKKERSWLDYGNFFIVSFGIVAVTIGFLVMLLFIEPFQDRSKALAFLVALFGVITGLVGTYFGVKQSADAREGAENLASGRDDTTPIITIEPPTKIRKKGTRHEVTAIVTNADKSRAANVAVTFTVTGGPDLNTGRKKKTDEDGRASWSFTNNGTAGTDTIEAKALEATDTATVKFEDGTARAQEQESAAEHAPGEAQVASGEGNVGEPGRA